jgi:hypothetical protein
MASQEELNNQKELNDEIRGQISLEQELLNILSRRIGINSQTLNSQQDISNVLSDQLKQLKFQSSERRSLLGVINSINKLTKDNYGLSVDILGKEKELSKVTQDISKLDKDIIFLKQQQLKFSKEEDELSQNIAENLKTQVQEAKDLQKELKKVQESSQKVSDNLGVKSFNALSDITKKIPGLSKFSQPFNDAAEASRLQAANNLKTFGSVKGASKEQIAMLKSGKDLTKELGLQYGLFDKNGKALSGTAAAAKAASLGLTKSVSPFMAGLKTLGPAIGAAFRKILGPAAIFLELISAFGRVNKETVELQKGMALSSREAQVFRADLGQAAALTGDINITTSKLLKSFSSLNKQFGFITNFASQTLVTMTRLTDVVGVSSEAAGNLAAASTLTGKSFESNYKDVLGTSYELQRQEGVQFDLREILEETGKVTGTVRANLGANPANIAKAITQAKLFGASLQQVASAGKSLLDFESSITSELEAELLLGRDINLERARLAALNGDQVTLAKELRKEAGDYDSFMKMNVLQQEAIAKAMGMQSDELADILFKQDIQGKTAKELRALGKDELADRLEAQTVQDKFNNSVEKLKEIFADVATALMPIFEVFGSIAQLVGLILSPFTAVINAATKFSPILGIIVGLLTAAATAAIVMNSALTFGVGTAIALAAAGGAIMLLNNNKDKATQVGDVMSEAKGKTMISTKEGGLFELSPNDDIIAAPGAARAMTRASQPQQPVVVQNDNTESKRTNMLLEQILSKQGTIKLDSTDMGTAMSVNRYAIQ